MPSYQPEPVRQDALLKNSFHGAEDEIVFYSRILPDSIFSILYHYYYCITLSAFSLFLYLLSLVLFLLYSFFFPFSSTTLLHLQYYHQKKFLRKSEEQGEILSFSIRLCRRSNPFSTVDEKKEGSFFLVFFFFLSLLLFYFLAQCRGWISGNFQAKDLRAGKLPSKPTSHFIMYFDKTVWQHFEIIQVVLLKQIM